MLTIRDLWGRGGMEQIEATAARQAIAHERRLWLAALEAAVERGEHVDAETLAAIRRLHRVLGFKPPNPSPEVVERRHQQNRDRVRRHRERKRQGIELRPAETPMPDEQALAKLHAAERRIARVMGRA